MIGLLLIMLGGAFTAGVRFLRVDDAVAQIIGLGTIVLVILGFWVLMREISFGRSIERLGRILDAEGGLPEDTVDRSPGGRPDREQADEQFARFQAEAEAAPEDWRSWFRLSVAYDVAGDRPRARRTMRQAIEMERASRNRR